MSAGSFKQDGLGWRINLIKQRFDEALEYRISQLDFGERDWDWDWDWGWGWGWDWEFIFKLLWQIIKLCLWSLIAILLVLMIWRLWLVLRPYWRRWQRPNDRNFPIAPSSTPQLSATDWVERSQSARIEGNYTQAIFCLYQAMLQLLDERGVIAAQASLTDLEYQRSLGNIHVTPLSPYELLLSTHQRLCFSNAEGNQALWSQCYQAYQQIEN